MLDKFQHRPILTLVVLVAVMLLINIDVLQVTIMEARNFISAREMLLDGNWILTTMNGEPRYQKPPLPTWITALSAMIFGLKSLFGLRLPGILMVMVTGIYAYLLSFELVKIKKQALVNGLLTVTSFYIVAIIIEAPWDIFAHGFMLIAIYHLFQFFEKSADYWKHILFAGIFIGFSILSKAPVSIYVLLLPFLLAYGFTYKFKNIKQKLFSIFSLLILSLAVGGWWFLYVRYSDPETFIAMASKETGNWSGYNVRPFYYYWSFFTQSGLWTIPAFMGLLYPYLKTRVQNLKAYKFTLLWTLFALILLSIIPEKKSRYLMPVLIPLALNTGFYINYLIEKFKDLKDKRETIPVYFNFGLIGLIAVLFPVAYFFLKEHLEGQYLILFLTASVFLVIIGVTLFIQLKRKHLSNVFLLSIAFMVCIFIFVLPINKAAHSANFKPLTAFKEQLQKEGLALYGVYVAPEMIWQYGDNIPTIKVDENRFVFPNDNTFGLLTNQLNEDDLHAIKQQYTMDYIKDFDLNTLEPTSRQYNKRLVGQYYKLTRK